MIDERRRRIVAASLAGGLLLVLLVFSSLGGLYRPNTADRVVLREMEVYVPPRQPPTPPATTTTAYRNAGGSGSALTLANSDLPVTLKTMNLDVQVAAGKLGVLNLGGVGNGIGDGSGDGSGSGLGGLVGFSELDTQPIVISAPVFEWPEEAIASGLDEFVIQFHIVIDEEGRTFPVAVLESPFPSSNAKFMEYASKVRFTPPTRLGIPVRTDNLWPLKIKR